MGTLAKLQAEQREWATHNFGSDRPAYHPVLGAVEEIGELCHTILKNEQGIRQDRTLTIGDAIADTVIYLADVCTAYGIDFESVVQSTWNEVKKRDWRKFPTNGITQ